MSTEKKSFLQKILDRLTGGDEGKINRFITQANKLAQATIKSKKEAIEDIKERINDLDDTITEWLENVQVEKLQNTDNSKAYAAEYIKGYMRLQEQMMNYQDQIENLEKEIELYEKFGEAIQ